MGQDVSLLTHQVQQLSLMGAEVALVLEDISAVAAYIPESAFDLLNYDPSVVLIEQDQRYLVGEAFGVQKEELDFEQWLTDWQLSLDPADQKAPNFDKGDFIPPNITMVNAHRVSDAHTANQTVCIIDSGLDSTHEDFFHDRIRGQNLPGVQWSIDRNSHGTHVAGTIAAAANGLGLVGVMPSGNVNLIIIKVFGDNGEWVYSSNVAGAATVCGNNGATVINMSLGGSSGTQAAANTFARLRDNGVLSIAAAGNRGNNSLSYPASYNAVMSVAATDNNRNRARFSQFNAQVEIAAPGVGVWSTQPMGTGRAIGGGVFVNNRMISSNRMQGAPAVGASGTLVDCGLGTSQCQNAAGRVCLISRGENTFAEKALNCQNGGGVAALIYNNTSDDFNGTLGTTRVDIPVDSITLDTARTLANQMNARVDFRVTSGGRNYSAKSGTSMATPAVAGVAALVWSHFPECTNQEIRRALNLTAEDLGTPGRNHEFGHGLVDARAAYNFLAANGCANQPPVTSPTPRPTAAPSPSPTAEPSVTATPSPTSAPVCGSAVSYQAGSAYQIGDLVSHLGRVFQCTGASGWCSQSAYEPGVSIHWAAAWTEVDCPSPTSSPTPSPTATNVPSPTVTATPSPTSTPTVTTTPSPSPTPTPTATTTPSVSPTVSATPTTAPDPSPTNVPTSVPSAEPEVPVIDPPRAGSGSWWLLMLMLPLALRRALSRH